jgi:hypothetical protein
MYLKTGMLMFLVKNQPEPAFGSPGAAGRPHPREFTAKKILFLIELCWNVCENKGPLWKSGAKPGMSMKINVVICQWPKSI